MREMQFRGRTPGVQQPSQGDRLGRLSTKAYPEAARGAGGGLVDPIDWDTVRDPDWYSVPERVFFRVMGSVIVWVLVLSAPIVVLFVGLWFKGLL